MTIAGTLDPYAARRLQAVAAAMQGGGRAPAILTPADVIGEQRLYEATVLNTGFAKTRDGKPPTDDDKVTIGQAIHQAIPFYWPNHLDSLLDPMPLPTHTVAPIKRPAELMWISYETSHPHRMEESGEEYDTDALLVCPQPDGLVIYQLGGFGIMGWLMNWGQAYPLDIGLGTLGEKMLKFFAFLNSPYTVINKHRPERAARREALRAGVVEEPEVHVVTLRQPVATTQESSSSKSVNWQHRWWVRGHFRAQWVPSLEGHRLTWIAPYVKGPAGLEFKSAVYVVSR